MRRRFRRRRIPLRKQRPWFKIGERYHHGYRRRFFGRLLKDS